MDTTLPTLAGFSGQPSLGLPALIEALVDVVRRPRRTADERELPALLEYSARRVAREFMSAESLEQFEHQLEETIDAEWFLSARYLLLDEILNIAPVELRVVNEGPVRQSASEFIVQTLGEGTAVHARRCGELMAEHMRATFALLGELERVGAVSAPVGEQLVPRSLMRHLLNAVSVPRSLRSSMRATLKADACLLAVVGSINPSVSSGPHQVEPWLAVALAKTLSESLYESLRFLAALPGIDVSTDVLPARDRLDLAEMMDEGRRWEEFMDRAVWRAQEAGGDVFFVTGAPLLDE